VRNNEVLFQSDNEQECIDFTDDVWKESSTDFIYAMVEEVND
jgi:hypothetical protein